MVVYYVILQQIEKKFTNANELQNNLAPLGKRYGSDTLGVQVRNVKMVFNISALGVW